MGERVLPAGIYRVQPMSSTRVALVRMGEGQPESTMASTMAVAGHVIPTHAKLVFRRYGQQYFLAQIWTPERNLSHELATSAAERSLKRQLKQTDDRLARGGSEAEVITLVSESPERERSPSPAPRRLVAHPRRLA